MPEEEGNAALQRQLVDCIIRGSTLDEMRIVLACGAKVNNPVTQGLRPLHYAAYRHYGEAVHLLLVRGSDINAVDDIGYAAMHLSAERGFNDIIALLLRHKAKINFSESTDPFPRTSHADDPLHLAIKNGHYETAKLLLQNGANPNAKYFLGSELNLISPASIKFMELLLKYGADPNVCDRSGLTPLMKACRHPNGLETALLLISFGANVNAWSTERQDRRSVLHYAVLSGNMNIVNLLVKQGAKLNFPESYCKPTPLDFAILRKNLDMVVYLLNHGADIDAASPIIGSPLHIALSDHKNCHEDIIKILLERGANPNVITYSDTGAVLLKPPLGEYFVSSDFPEEDIVRLMLKYGAKIVIATQRNHNLGILKTLYKLANCTGAFYAVLNAAQQFQTLAIKTCPLLNEEMKDILMKAARRPLTLKHQSRLKIRSLISRDQYLPEKIRELELPKSLKAYVLYER